MLPCRSVLARSRGLGEALLVVLAQYRDEFGALMAAIERGDAKWLEDTFMRAKRARDALNGK